MRQKLGKAVIKYNKKGEIKDVVFKSNMKLGEIGAEILSQNIDMFKGVKDKKDVENASQLTLSMFFSKITEIELRDLEKEEIIHSLECSTRDTGEISKCTIKYYLVSK